MSLRSNLPTMLCGDKKVRADNGCKGRGPIAKTSAYTVLKSDTGTIFSNSGASGSVTFTLPAVLAGLRFTFLVVAAQTVVVLASGGAKINGSGANGNITAAGSQALSGVADVFCDGTNWYCTLNATWTTT